MAGAPTPQIVCQGDQCTPLLPIPPFQPSPLPPPNNVLVIPVPQPAPGACDRFGKSSIDFLTDAIDNYANSAFPICGPPLRMRTGDCWAEIYGCPRFAGDETCGSGSYLGSLLSPGNPGLPHAPYGGTVRHDTDPNYDQKVLAGTLNCAAPLIVFNDPPPPLPPPEPTAPLCHDGSTPSAAPCDGQCFEQVANGCCPCDPPLPYGGSGPFVDGSDNSTEGFWMFAPTPTGIPLAVHDAIDPTAAITPTVPRIRAPLMVPLPTAAIAVTACNSCGADSSDEEFDELA